MDTRLKFRLAKLRTYLELVKSKVVRETASAADVRVLEPAEPRYDAPPDDGKWKPVSLGDAWGGKQQWAYFRAAVAVPSHWKGEAIELRLGHRASYLEALEYPISPAGPEGQAFIEGQRVGAIDREHSRIRYPFKPGKRYDVRAVFFAGQLACRHALETFGLAWVDGATEKLYHDLRVTLEVIDLLDENSPSREKLIAAVDAAAHAMDVREALGAVPVPLDEQRDPGGEAFYASVPAAQKAFDAARAKVAACANVPELVALGHAHIDLAWLWPLSQTRHKCVRTWATQCRLLEQYPDWVFFQSSPQAYAWVEQDAPDLFEQIRKHVAAGRWEPGGTTWVETDTIISGGESLVRQLLYGRRYLLKKFGVESRVVWMPDVFGYSAALPQLLRLAGVEGFVAGRGKFNWNQFNRFPYDTFRWRGLDGTEVIAHLVAWVMSVEHIKRCWDNYPQKELGLERLTIFGHSDGGGGATEELLEMERRLASMPPVEGMPKVTFGKVGDLIRRMASQAARLPVWNGELYYECHQGTYTTQAWLKRANRKNEIRLHALEWLAALAGEHGYRLDKARLDAMWQNLMLTQFHDILPGTSVTEVYDDEVRPMHERIAQETDTMTAEAADVLCKKIDTAGARKPVVLFNTLSWERRDPVRLPDGMWRDDVVVPAGGWAVVDAAEKPARDKSAELAVSKDGREMTNRFWRLRLDERGRIVELYDRLNDRQVLPQGAVANEWLVFEDRPDGWDAWNYDPNYETHPLPGPEHVSTNVVERGDVRAAVELKWQMPQVGTGPRSTITQRIVVYANHPRIDFETHADWHEHHQLLKLAVPVNVRAREATYEIQFGHVRRPTHRNTSWDEAKYEAWAHRFVDLAEHGYGVALLNDCKYGHDVHDGVIRLTCIKCPQSPDRTADQGLHEFTYALLPHAGTFQDAGVIRAAAELNVPLMAKEAAPSSGKLPVSWSFVQSDNEAVIVETLKPAEDGKGLILRLYESHGSHARATLTFSGTLNAVEHVDLLEEPLAADVGLEHAGERVSLRLRPFQVVTLRVIR